MLLLLLRSAGAVSAPVVDFVGSPLQGTVPLAVQLTDESTNSPFAWSWTITGQQTGTVYTSSDQDPLITILVTDIYDVELEATNGEGTGSLTKLAYINCLLAPAQVRYPTWSAEPGVQAWGAEQGVVGWSVEP